MSSFLSQIDMYGSKFHFRVFKDNKSISQLGGFMTILTMLILGVFLYLFGQDFFYKKNPQVTKSGILPAHYSKVDLNKEKIIVPWRIEDISSLPVDPTGILYPRIYYYTAEKNPETAELENIRTEYLDYYQCNITDLNTNQTGLKIDNYYCFDLTNKPIGGYWDGEFVYYLEIQLYFCPEGKVVGEENNCTDIEILNQHLNNENPWYFSIYFPTHQFQPEEYDDPVKIHYAVHFTQIDPVNRKNDRLYFNEIQLIDDKGLIFESKKQCNFWVAEKLTQESVYYPEKRLIEKGQSSKIYTMNVYGTLEKILYTRIYDKLYDVLAVVGGFSQIVIMAFRTFCEYFNMIKMKTNLINSSFYFDKYELLNKPTNVHENSVENPFTEPKFQGAKVSKFSIL